MNSQGDRETTEESENSYFHEFRSLPPKEALQKYIALQALAGNDTLVQLLKTTSSLKIITYYLAVNTDDFDTHIIYNILEIDLKVIQQYYRYFKNNHQTVRNELRESLNAVFADCKELQQNIVHIITNNTQLFVYSSKRKSSDVNEFASFVSLVDVKTTADIWKCISKLGAECSGYVKAQNVETTWFRHAIKFLCEQMIDSVSVILAYSREESAHSFPKIEKILKVNSFYLKIVTRFLADYGQEYFQGFDSLVKLCIVLNSFPESIAETKLAQSTRQYLTIGVNSLIIGVYRSPNFEKALSSYDHTNIDSFSGFLLLCLQVMEYALVSGDPLVVDVYFCGKKPTIFDKMLEAPCIQIFQRQNFYERLISSIVATIISVVQTPRALHYFEKKLLGGILGNDYVRGVLCCDVMCALFRFASEEIRYHYFKFYFKIYNETPIFATKPNVIFLKHLLRNFYEIISDSQKQSLLEQLTSPDLTIKLALILNKRNASSLLNFRRYVTAAGGMLGSDVENLRQDPKTESYYQTVKDLLLVELDAMNDALYKQIEDIWVAVLCHENNRCFNILIKSITNLLCTKKHNSSIVNNLLKEADYSTMSEMSRFYSMRLSMLSVSNEHEYIEFKMKVSNLSLECDIKLLLYIQHSSQAEIFITSHKKCDDIHKREMIEPLFAHLETYNLEHLCDSYQEESSNNENPPKRMRINESSTTCPLLLEAENIAIEVKQFYENEEIGATDLEHIARIVSIFNDINKNSK